MLSGLKPHPPSQSRQEVEAERRKIRPFLQGASSHLAAGDEVTMQPNVGHSPRPPLCFYSEPGRLNTACCTQGSGVLQEPCTV